MFTDSFFDFDFNDDDDSHRDDATSAEGQINTLDIDHYLRTHGARAFANNGVVIFNAVNASNDDLTLLKREIIRFLLTRQQTASYTCLRYDKEQCKDVDESTVKNIIYDQSINISSLIIPINISALHHTLLIINFKPDIDLYEQLTTAIITQIFSIFQIDSIDELLKVYNKDTHDELYEHLVVSDESFTVNILNAILQEMIANVFYIDSKPEELTNPWDTLITMAFAAWPLSVIHQKQDIGNNIDCGFHVLFNAFMHGACNTTYQHLHFQKEDIENLRQEIQKSLRLPFPEKESITYSQTLSASLPKCILALITRCIETNIETFRANPDQVECFDAINLEMAKIQSRLALSHPNLFTTYKLVAALSDNWKEFKNNKNNSEHLKNLTHRIKSQTSVNPEKRKAAEITSTAAGSADTDEPPRSLPPRMGL